MIGLITVYWECGYKKIYPIFTILSGITYNNRRPYRYSLDITDITAIDTKYLCEYLQHVNKILDVSK